MPIDIKIRAATPGDAAHIARLHVKAWQTSYRGIVHQSYLDGMDVGARTERWREGLGNGKSQTFLAFEHANLAGFTTVGPSREEQYPSHFELWSIYLDPAYVGRGVGKLLFNRAVQHGLEQGFTQMFVNVLDTNKTGRQFYERMGGVAVHGSEFEAMIDNQAYTEMKYEWRELKL